MLSFPRIETLRLVLRQPVEKDVPHIVQNANDPAIADGTLNIPYPYTEKDARFLINMSAEGFEKRDKYVFIIELKETRYAIGDIGLSIVPRFDRAEIGFWIGKNHWNKGYCTEALRAVMDFGFNTLKLNKLGANHFPHNPSSGHVMKKCGMVKEGELLQHAKKRNTYLDLIQYRITNPEYQHLAK